MKSRLFSILGLCCCALVCGVSSLAAQDEKGGNQNPPNAPGTIRGGTQPVPEAFSTLWLALPAIAMFALVRRQRKKV